MSSSDLPNTSSFRRHVVAVRGFSVLALLGCVTIGLCAAWGLWWISVIVAVPTLISVYEAWDSLIEAALEVLDDKSEGEISGESGR